MHTFIVVRGVKHWVDEFVNDLSAQWAKYNHHGNEQLLKIGVRPIKIFEIVYPASSHEDVMKMLMPFDNYKTRSIGRGLYFLFLPLVKALGIKKNKTKSKGVYNNYKVFHPYVDVMILGHKGDYYDADGTEKI